MIELKIEAIVASAIAALNIDGLLVERSLGAPVEETGDELAVLTISTGNRAQAMWEIPQFDIEVELQLVTRIDGDPDKAKHLSAVEKLVEMFVTWSGRGGAAAFRSAFAIPGEFEAAYIQLGGGQNIVDRDNGVYIWTQSATIRGIINTTINQGAN